MSRRWRNVSAIERIFFILLSLALATLLWVQVTSENDPRTQREMLVKLELKGIPNNLMAINAPDRARVIAEGTIDELNRLNAESMFATIDLEGAKPGTRSYPVSLAIPSRFPARIALQRTAQQITIARQITVTMPVVVDLLGKLSNDLHYDGSTVQPEKVELRMPEMSREEIGKVRALLDLGKIQAGVTYQLKVEAFDQAGKRMPSITIEPETVSVFPSVAAAPTSGRFSISPNWKGTPAVGWRIRSFNITPSQAVLFGRPEALAEVASIETEAIDLTNAQGVFSRSINLRAPAGTKLGKDKSVVVQVNLERIPDMGGQTLPTP